MKNYIKDNLTVKLFLITCSLLIFVSLLICGLIAILMPRSYVQVQNEQLDRDIKSLIAQVENTEFMQAGKLFADFTSQQQITLELHDTTQNLNIIFENHSAPTQQVFETNDSNAITIHEYMAIVKYTNAIYNVPRLIIEGRTYSLIIAGLNTENEEFDNDLENLVAQLENTDFTQAEQLWTDFVRQQQEVAGEQQILLILRDTTSGRTEYILTDGLRTATNAGFDGLRTATHTGLSIFADFYAIFDADADTIVTKHITTSYSISGLMLEGEIYSLVIAGVRENEGFEKDLLNLIAQVKNIGLTHSQQIVSDFVNERLQELVSEQKILIVSHEASSDYTASIVIGEQYVHRAGPIESNVFTDFNLVIRQDADEIISTTGNTSYIVTELMIDGNLYSLTMTVITENEQFEKDFQNLIAQAENTDFTQAKKLFANFASQQQINVEIHSKTENTSYEITGLMIAEKFYSLTAELGAVSEQFEKDFQNLIAQVKKSDFTQSHNLLADFASQQQIALTLHDASENLNITFDNSTVSSESNQETLQTTEAGVTTITETEKAVSESDNVVIFITSDDDTMAVENSDSFYDSNVVTITEAIMSESDVLMSNNDEISLENDDSSYEVLIEGQIYSLIITGLSTEAVNQITFVLKNILPWIILVMTGLSFIIALFSSKMITKPIQRLNDATKQIAELSFDINCDEKRTDELGQLAKNINFLSSKLNTTLTSLQDEIEHEKMLEEKQRLFFAAASHELKTPLTIIKGNLEGMFYGYKEYQDKDTYISSSLRTTCEMQKLINEILHVSQLDAKGMKLQLETVNVKKLIDDIVENYKEIIELKKFTVICQLADVSRQVDKALFIKALQNIIGNAFHYSPDGAKVLITLSENLISVENFGLTLVQTEIKKVFQPFYRVEKSRNRQTGGSGLGLHFVKTILEQHKLVFSMVGKKDSIVFEIQI